MTSDTSAHDQRAHEFGVGNGQLIVMADPDAPAWPHAAELCRAAAAAAVPFIPSLHDAERPWTATIRLASDDSVQRLNREYRGKDKPTNVLSFESDPADSEGEDEVYVGDIIIALPTVRREAEAAGRTPDHHLQHLALHGLLHLAGHDHIDDAEADAMEGLEVKVLALLGITDPYAAIDDNPEGE